LLNTLARDALPAPIVAAVARHDKWSKLVNIRVALLRHPHAPLELVPALVPGLPRREIQDLLELSRLPEYVRAPLREELTRGKN
jgi:stage III sporulation protein SpoIIIAA